MLDHSSEKLTVRLTEKDYAHYFSNAAASYVLAVGFGVFAVKAQSFMIASVCFWFSIFMLCDCFRLARACRRFTASQFTLLTMDAKGITHFGCWIEPETISWKEISGFRSLKGPTSETLYFLSRHKLPFFRQAFFGAPKLDLPLTSLKGGREALMQVLEDFPAARHLLPARARTTVEDLRPAA